MSVTLMAEVWKLQLDGSGKRDVLLVMADHADDDGVCWPSVGLVAWKTDKQDRSVQRIQRQLEADGLIECIGNETGGFGRSKIWQLHLDRGVEKSPYKSTSSVREDLARLTSGTTSVELDDPGKGDEMSPTPERVTPARETPTPAREKGDVAVSPEPSGTTNEPPSTSSSTSVADPEVLDRPEISHLCSLLATLVSKNTGREVRATRRWGDACRLLLDRDGRDPDEVEKVMRWACDDEFWRANILSFPKFRQKFDTLRLQSERKVALNGNGRKTFERGGRDHSDLRFAR